MDDLAFSVTFELGQTFLASPGLTGHGVWRSSARSSFASRDALAVAPFGFLLFDSVYALDPRGALAFEREGFVLDPATGQLVSIDSQSGSCERIIASAR